MSLRKKFHAKTRNELTSSTYI